MALNQFNLEQMIHIRKSVMDQEPLIHCITNPITMNDCANMVLAVGGRPIMAEHPSEIGQITKSAKALAVNLGNISDARMQSMMISGRVARAMCIPIVMDSVGVACSSLRLDFARRFIEECKPSVIKGNMSEIKAIIGTKTTAEGIDVSQEDQITENTLEEHIHIVKTLAKRTQAIVVATGVLDIVSDKEVCYVIANGCKALSKITGTGCMLNVIIATLISTGEVLNGAILGTSMMGICGELAGQAKGLGSFKIELFDAMSTLSNQVILDKIKLRDVSANEIRL